MGLEALGIVAPAALDVAQSGALQQPLFSTPGIEAARVESGRVAEAVGAPRLFNELPEGVEPLTSFDPASVAQAGGDIAEQIAGTTSLAPAAPIGPVTSAPVNTGFEQFAQANQGIRPGGQGAPVLEGSRIIRRPGETPILTNLTGSALESGLADNRQFVTNETTGQSRTLDPDTLALEGISPVGEAGPVAGGGLRTRARTQEEEILKGIEGKDFSFGRRPTTGRGFLAGATALGLERARVSAAAGAQERDFEQDLATQELGLRGREVAAKETTAQAATATAAAKATAGAKLTDRLKALGDVTRRTNPVSGTTELVVGTTSIPQSQIPVFENFASSFQSDPDFQTEHGNKTPAEQDRIAARMSVELMTAQGLVASGRAASGIEEIEKAFGG
jgi:hypothetical protein